ncbi:MFS transporter [Halomonas litopenaei]|uniref:MFS transporter n=1 Tax=Halomonas litopenaei TaxID=2109328 RepID=UPI003F9F9D83
MIHANTPAWRRATLALCLGSMLVFINLYAPQPLLPLLRDTHDASTLKTGLVMSLATLTLALSLLVYGPLSDAIGRGGIMRVSLSVAALATLLAAFAPGLDWLLAARVLQGVALGGLPAVAIAWMGDEFSPEAMSRAVGLYIAANTLGGIGGRVLGGVVGEWYGVQASFVAVGGLTLVGVAVFWWLLPAASAFTAQPFRLGHACRQMRGHLANPWLLPAYLIGGLNFLVFINQYSYMTFRLAEAPFALGPRWLGLLFLTYLGGTLGSMLSARVVARSGAPATMGLGVVIMVLALGLSLVPVLAVIIAALTLSAFGFFLCHATASGWVGRQAREGRGGASALYLVFYYLGASLGPLWLEPFWLWQGWPGVVAASWLVLATTGWLSWRLGKRLQRAQHQRVVERRLEHV